jgi:hypothetical protein
METYSPKDITLLNFCDSFFKRALDILVQYINSGGHIPTRTFYEPVPHFDDKGRIESFSYVPYEDQDFGYLTFKCHGLLEGISEANYASNYISDKKYLLIGDANFSPHTLLDEALKDYLKRTKSLNYQEHEFLNTYEKIEKLIFGKEFIFRSTAKLENFSCDIDVIKLDDMHFIKRYSQEECKELYRHPSINIYDYTLPHPGDFRIEVIKSKDKDDWGKAGIGSKEEIKQIITTLRLFKDSAIGIGVLEFSEPITWFPFTSKAQQLLPPHTVGDLCSIEETEIEGLINLWKIISRANYKNCPPLEIAIKRFNYAHEHKDREDSLVDIMIGFEALFIKEQDELSFRLALRASTFLEAFSSHHKNERKTIFDNIKKAYRLRSGVVHGSKVPESKIWECKIVKTYLSDSIKLSAKLSQKHNHREILSRIDECIKGGSNEDLKALCL